MKINPIPIKVSLIGEQNYGCTILILIGEALLQNDLNHAVFPVAKVFYFANYADKIHSKVLFKVLKKANSEKDKDRFTQGGTLQH